MNALVIICIVLPQDTLIIILHLIFKLIWPEEDYENVYKMAHKAS